MSGIMKWTVFVFPLTRRRNTSNQRAYVDPRADRRAARIKANLHFHAVNMRITNVKVSTI